MHDQSRQPTLAFSLVGRGITNAGYAQYLLKKLKKPSPGKRLIQWYGIALRVCIDGGLRRHHGNSVQNANACHA